MIKRVIPNISGDLIIVKPLPEHYYLFFHAIYYIFTAHKEVNSS